MARRTPFGANANPPTVDGTSSMRSGPLPLRANACLPADHATAPFGPTATWSIQRRLPSVATTVPSPSAAVDTTLPSSPPVTMRPASAVEHRMAPPCTAAVRTSPVFGTTISASSPSTNTAVWPRKCAATTGASALSGRVRSTTEGISLLVSVTAQSALFLGMQVYGDRAHTARMRAALEGGNAWNCYAARGSVFPPVSRHNGRGPRRSLLALGRPAINYRTN